MNIKVAVVGLGYVGLPLLIQISKKYKVIGYDVSRKRINNLKNNIDSTSEISSKLIRQNKKKINFTYNEHDLKSANFYIVTVPTPIFKNKKPDLSYIKSACETIGKALKKKDIVVFECTVYPGVTENFCANILSNISGLKFNKDFFLGYSPERINPGDKKYTIDKIKKVVSGSKNQITNRIYQFYNNVIDAGAYRAKSIKVAESAKVIENIQRDLNISLINEFSIIFDKLNLNIFDILKTASTKWNFLKFEPGLVGGHCIGVDPYYLTYLSKKLNYNPKLILAGREINEKMPEIAANKLVKYLKKENFRIKKISALFLGLTFKENCSDLRNSKNLVLLNLIKKRIKDLTSYDPNLDYSKLSKKFISENKISKKFPVKKFDLIIIAVPHNKFKKWDNEKIAKLLKRKTIIFDLKNKMKNFRSDLTL